MQSDSYRQGVEDEAQPFSSQRYSFKGNQPFLLNEPKFVWIVQSGTIALFATQINHDRAVGPRRYLFSCEPGEVIFAATGDQGQTGLLAVPLEATQLLRVGQLEALHPDQQAAFLETWLQKLTAAIAPLPLSSADLNFKTLAQLHTQFFQNLTQLQAEEQAQEASRLEAQMSFNQQASTKTLQAFASLLQPDHDKQPDFTDADNHPNEVLYQAAQAVGQAMNIVIRRPQVSELQDSNDPLDAIVRASRVRMRRVLLSDRWWEKDCGALLAYRIDSGGNKSAIALLPIAANRYEVFDPITKTRTPIVPSLLADISPVAYLFYRSFPEGRVRVLGLLRFGLRGSNRDRFTLLWTGIATVLLGMLTPQVTATLIDTVIPSGDRGLLAQLGLGLLAAVLGGTLFQFVQETALARIETRLEASTQAALWDRLLTLTMPFFRHYAIGDLRSRASAINTIRRQISGTPLRTLFSSIFALLNLGLLFFYSPHLALIATFAACVILGVTAVCATLLLQQVQPLQELDGKNLGLLVQIIQGVSKLRLAGAELRAFANWGNYYHRQQQFKLKIQAIKDNLLVCNQLVVTLSAAILFGATTLLSRDLSTGTFLAFYVAFGNFMAGAINLSNIVIEFLPVIALWQRSQPILSAQPEVNSGKVSPGRLSGWVSLHQVTFRYQEGSAAVLENVSIHSQPGEFIAIVGPSGSGKSTLVRLLLGFETPQSGQVYYDGRDLATSDIHAVRRQLGVLLQASRTQTGSIFENIAGSALITMDEAWQAAQRAGLADEIAALPMGMHTVISEAGGNLSGGQRQRLLIARALALNPRILLFDEATSSLDNRTQAIVSQSLEQLQVTRIVIAHRLSTIKNADRIYVLQAGRVVQQGTFAELIEQEGLFVQLMRRQKI